MLKASHSSRIVLEGHVNVRNFLTRYDWFNGDFVNVTRGSQHGNEAAKLKIENKYDDRWWSPNLATISRCMSLITLAFPRQWLGRGDGKGILHRDSLKCLLFDGRELKSFEYCEYSVKLSCKTLRVIIVYCPPRLPQNQVLLYIFLRVFYPLAVLCLAPLLITDDFKFQLDDHQNADTRRFCQILITFGIRQHVSVLTHVWGRTLDLLISRSVADGVPLDTFLISYHYSVINQMVFQNLLLHPSTCPIGS